MRRKNEHKRFRDMTTMEKKLWWKVNGSVDSATMLMEWHDMSIWYRAVKNEVVEPVSLDLYSMAPKGHLT